jgi:hypothetical protein
MINGKSRYLLVLAGNIVGIASLVITALFLIPFSPNMPNSGLDNSWAYALNMATKEGLVFGRDVVFSFGPLASVYSQVYSPATDLIMMIWSTVLAVGFCILMGLALTPGRLIYAVVLPVIVAMSLLLDGIFFVTPFLLLFIIARTQLKQGDRFYLYPTLFIQICSGFTSMAVGAIPIIKGSFTGSVGVTCVIAFFILALGSLKKAFAFAVLCLLGLIFAWISSGQYLTDLPHYFIAQTPIISDYANAMSSSGLVRIPLLVGFVSFAIVIYFYFLFGRRRGVVGIGASLGLFLVLFIAFKAGLVRQDGHVFITTGVLLVVALLITAYSSIVPALILWTLVIVTWENAGNAAFPMGYGYRPIIEWTEQRWMRSINGIRMRISSSENLQTKFANANTKIRKKEPLPAVKGTVDIYPTELSAIFANNLNWRGRPVFQSYSVYNPQLDRLNAEHLERAGADTIFFSLDPIDNRLPALEDSSNLIGILARYSAVAFDGKYVQFERQAGSTASLESTAFLSRDARLGERVEVPGDTPLWTMIDVKPTLTGKLVSAAYKLPHLEIELTLSDGSIVRKRFISAMGGAGFILSPYLSRAEDMLALAGGIQTLPSVVAFKIESEKKSRLWNQAYHLQFKHINITPSRAARKLALTQPSEVAPPVMAAQNNSQPEIKSALCAIDSANRTPFAGSNHVVVMPNGVLPLVGWAAPATTPVQANSIQTYFVVQDATGAHFFAAQPHNRPDVAAVYQRPELAMSGFDLSLDLGEMNAPRSFEILVVADGAISRCPFEVPISVFSLSEVQIPRAVDGKSVQELDLVRCQGNIDTVTVLPGDQRHVRLGGWAFDTAYRRVPATAFIVSNDHVIGTVRTGIERPDVSAAIDEKAVRAGFEGYARSVDKSSMTIWCPK